MSMGHGIRYGRKAAHRGSMSEIVDPFLPEAMQMCPLSTCFPAVLHAHGINKLNKHALLVSLSWQM